MDFSTDSASGQLIRLSDVPRLKWLPPRRGGSRLSYPALWRWAKYGTSGVKLKTVRVGSAPCTTEIWVREFFSDVAHARAGNQTTQPSPRQPAARDRAIATSKRRLIEAGL